MALREFNFKANPRTARAARLIEWTVDCEIRLANAVRPEQSTPPLLWPAGLPRPRQRTQYASDGHVADELFLCAGAFILHHELAHFRCMHKWSMFSEDNREMEVEADAAAASWILDGVERPDPRFGKRALGLAIALGWLTSIAAYVVEDQTHHPPSTERLSKILGNYIDDDDDVIWAVVSTILRANLEAAKIPYDRTRKGGFRQRRCRVLPETLPTPQTGKTGPRQERLDEGQRRGRVPLTGLRRKPECLPTPPVSA